MTHQAIPDIVTVVGSSYCQPIADLISRLLARRRVLTDAASAGFYENGYSASVTILLVALLESYISRLRYIRAADIRTGAQSPPDLLQSLFPNLPNHKELIEVFLLRNLVLHNHIFELDVRFRSEGQVLTMRSPQDFNFQVNQHYDRVVNKQTRRTTLLGLSATPDGVDRTDVLKVFQVVWTTLLFLQSEDLNVCSIDGETVSYEGATLAFSELRVRLQSAL